MPVLDVDDPPVGRDPLDVHVEDRQEHAHARGRHPGQVQLGWGHHLGDERDRAVGGREDDARARRRHAVRVAEEGGDGGRRQHAGEGAAAGEDADEPGGRGDARDDRAPAGMHRRDRRPDQRGDVRERGRRDPAVGFGGGVTCDGGAGGQVGRGYVA